MSNVKEDVLNSHDDKNLHDTNGIKEGSVLNGHGAIEDQKFQQQLTTCFVSNGFSFAGSHLSASVNTDDNTDNFMDELGMSRNELLEVLEECQRTMTMDQLPAVSSGFLPQPTLQPNPANHVFEELQHVMYTQDLIKIDKDVIEEMAQELTQTDLENFRCSASSQVRLDDFSASNPAMLCASDMTETCQTGSSPTSKSDSKEVDEIADLLGECDSVYVRVGKEYQAVLPEPVHRGDNDSEDERMGELLWDPSRSDNTDAYLRKARDIRNAIILQNDHHLNRLESGKDEFALTVLHNHNYNTEDALKYLKTLSTWDKNQIPLWSEKECERFELGIETFKKNFLEIQKVVKTRTLREVISYYYKWKCKRKSRSTYLKLLKDSCREEDSDIEKQQEASPWKRKRERSVSPVRSLRNSRQKSSTPPRAYDEPVLLTVNPVRHLPEHHTVNPVSHQPIHHTMNAVSHQPIHHTVSPVIHQPLHHTVSPVSHQPIHHTVSPVIHQPAHHTVSPVSHQPVHHTVSPVSHLPELHTVSPVSHQPIHHTLNAVSHQPIHHTVSPVSHQPIHHTLNAVSHQPIHHTVSPVSHQPIHHTVNAVSHLPEHHTVNAVSHLPEHHAVNAVSHQPIHHAVSPVSHQPIHHTVNSTSLQTLHHTVDSTSQQTVHHTVDSTSQQTVHNTVDSTSQQTVHHTVDSTSQQTVHHTVDSTSQQTVHHTVDSTSQTTQQTVHPTSDQVVGHTVNLFSNQCSNHSEIAASQSTNSLSNGNSNQTLHHTLQTANYQTVRDIMCPASDLHVRHPVHSVSYHPVHHAMQPADLQLLNHPVNPMSCQRSQDPVNATSQQSVLHNVNPPSNNTNDFGQVSNHAINCSGHSEQPSSHSFSPTYVHSHSREETLPLPAKLKETSVGAYDSVQSKTGNSVNHQNNLSNFLDLLSAKRNCDLDISSDSTDVLGLHDTAGTEHDYDSDLSGSMTSANEQDLSEHKYDPNSSDSSDETSKQYRLKFMHGRLKSRKRLHRSKEENDRSSEAIFRKVKMIMAGYGTGSDTDSSDTWVRQ